jgi:hypothetical protein
MHDPRSEIGQFAEETQPKGKSRDSSSTEVGSCVRSMEAGCAFKVSREVGTVTETSATYIERSFCKPVWDAWTVRSCQPQFTAIDGPRPKTVLRDTQGKSIMNCLWWKNRLLLVCHGSPYRYSVKKAPTSNKRYD